MIRLSLYIGVLFAIALIASILSPLQGSVSMQLGDYRVDTSALALGALVMVVFLVWQMVYALMRYIFLSPSRFRHAKSERKYKRSLEEVTATLTAIAAGDAAKARKHHKHTSKLLASSALPHILDAQIAGLERDSDRLQHSLNALLEHHTTKTLAHRGLAELNARKGDLNAATLHAQHALLAEPKHAQTGSSLLSLHIRNGEWDKAHALLRNKHYRRGLGRSGCRLMDTKLILAEVQHLVHLGDPHAALDRAEIAHHLNSHFLPATLALIDLNLTHKRVDAAKKLLQHAWKDHPHPALAAYVFTLPGDSFDRSKLAEKLTRSYPNHPQTHYLNARLKLDDGQYTEARNMCKKALDISATRAGYALMADIEHREYSDAKRRDQWLQKADALPRDGAWKCESCGHEHTRWQLHCESCNAFDTVDWR